MNVLITGGAGFIGSNLAAHWLELGYNVRILDNLSRSGTEKNLAWLETLEKQNLEVVQEDIRDSEAVSEAIRNVDVVVHLAAQVAVTTSVTDPRIDFEINTTGTLNMLESRPTEYTTELMYRAWRPARKYSSSRRSRVSNLRSVESSTRPPVGCSSEIDRTSEKMSTNFLSTAYNWA